MDIRIEEIYSKKMFPGLLLGKAENIEYEETLSTMKTLLGNLEPIIIISELKWTQLTNSDGKSLGYGTYGHLTGIKIEIADGDDRYSFSVIFNYLPEKENLNDKINQVISEIDWKENSTKWDISDW